MHRVRVGGLTAALAHSVTCQQAYVTNVCTGSR